MGDAAWDVWETGEELTALGPGFEGAVCACGGEELAGAAQAASRSVQESTQSRRNMAKRHCRGAEVLREAFPCATSQLHAPALRSRVGAWIGLFSK